MSLAMVLTPVIIYVGPVLVQAGFFRLRLPRTARGIAACISLGHARVESRDQARLRADLFPRPNNLGGHWPAYAALWWLVYALGEIGQAIGPGYGWKEAIAGIASETLYFPAAAWVVHPLLAV